ncbi:hypothetical protein [Burkholderia sp. SRS-W-2-2016]|uniref:hypothetical protein n=1 Tax=Burkholderia sp. SRS-W-2-2016 TaxID=1926878 RepID=UPI0021168803|nr:hypothetical protein [Burkholderia sp. SRS-W-2-2016]
MYEGGGADAGRRGNQEIRQRDRFKPAIARQEKGQEQLIASGRADAGFDSGIEPKLI